MDQSLLTINDIIQLLKYGGWPTIVLVMWFISYRDTQKTLVQYKRDMDDQRQMYENNVELVKQVIDIAKNQQDVIIMNTRMMQGLVDRIESNQFCPMVRLKKIEGVEHGR